MCSKVTYQTKNHALSGAIRASYKAGKPLRAYRCHLCKKWHLSKKKKNWWEDEQNG